MDLEIYQLAGSDRWQMELLHQDGSFSVWLRDFATDHEAMAEFDWQLSVIGFAKLMSGEPVFLPESYQS